MKPNDKLLLVYSSRNEQREVTVSRVGRKWAYVSERPRYRIALTEYDGYSAGSVYEGDYSVGVIWPSREEYEVYQRVAQRRREFTERIYSGDLPFDLERLNSAWAVLWGEEGEASE